MVEKQKTICVYLSVGVIISLLVSIFTKNDIIEVITVGLACLLQSIEIFLSYKNKFVSNKTTIFAIVVNLWLITTTIKLAGELI